MVSGEECKSLHELSHMKVNVCVCGLEDHNICACEISIHLCDQ